MAASAADPLLWEDLSASSPPLQWEFVSADDRWWWNATSQAQDPVTYIGTDPLPTSLELDYEIVTPPVNGNMILRHTQGGVDVNVSLGSSGSGSVVITVADPDASFSFRVYAENDPGEDMYGATVAVLGPALATCAAVNFNCDCTDAIGDSYPTLAALRRRLMIRLGFAVQADTPPPGMAILLDDFLQSAQTQLWNKHKELRGERFFTWDMEPGVRLYDLQANSETCTLKLDPLKLSWVGIEDATDCDNGTWLQLSSGIPPEYYTTVTSWGMPSCYEIRQCIEVFPPPDRAYRLRIKGHFAQTAFATGTDQCSIDGELLFLWALSDAKAHYGKPDAANIRAAAVARLGDMKAGRHGTKRYIPGASVAPNRAKPLFLPLVDE